MKVVLPCSSFVLIFRNSAWLAPLDALKLGLRCLPCTVLFRFEALGAPERETGREKKKRVEDKAKHKGERGTSCVRFERSS